MNTQLDEAGDLDPKVPPQSTSPKVLFCANLVPMLQSKVLEQATEKALIYAGIP